MVTKTWHKVIIRAASIRLQTTREIHSTYGCTLSVCRVQQLMLKVLDLNYCKMQGVPYLKSRIKRLECNRPKIMYIGVHFGFELSSLTKKFNLDGLDRFTYYCHELRNEQKYFSKRQQGGLGVTMWTEISYYGLSRIARISGTTFSEKYIQALNKCLLLFSSEECPTDCIYQQDNAPCRVSNDTKQFLSDRYGAVLPFPLSP